MAGLDRDSIWDGGSGRPKQAFIRGQNWVQISMQEGAIPAETEHIERMQPGSEALPKLLWDFLLTISTAIHMYHRWM